jgi:hypothetical protein
LLLQLGALLAPLQNALVPEEDEEEGEEGEEGGWVNAYSTIVCLHSYATTHNTTHTYTHTHTPGYHGTHGHVLILY